MRQRTKEHLLIAGVVGLTLLQLGFSAWMLLR